MPTIHDCPPWQTLPDGEIVFEDGVRYRPSGFTGDAYNPNPTKATPPEMWMMLKGSSQPISAADFAAAKFRGKVNLGVADMRKG